MNKLGSLLLAICKKRKNEASMNLTQDSGPDFGTQQHIEAVITYASQHGRQFTQSFASLDTKSEK